MIPGYYICVTGYYIYITIQNHPGIFLPAGPETPSFLDVKKNSWEYPYVESAKPYLTGFRTAAGDYFKPSLPAVREDMAVALVNALGYLNDPVDLGILDQFADKDQISPNLRKHVALSVKYGLIVGKPKNGRLVFDPQGNLTRAEAAVLIKRAFEKNEEKVTYDEEKVTYDPETGYVYERPIIELKMENNAHVLRWNKIDSPRLIGYIVSASRDDSSVSYPDNGFLYRISDVNRTYAVIDNSTKYSNGDFGGYFINGEQYYFSVTAVYGDRMVAGNTIRCKYVGEDSPELFPAPQVNAVYEDGKLVVKWNRLDSPLLTEYRVVISEKNEKPVYPANGYYDMAYDKDTTSVVIDPAKQYHGGDFEKLTYAKEYYISVTAVYGSKYVAGNAVKVLYLINDQQPDRRIQSGRQQKG